MVEIMVVLVVIGLVMTVAAPHIMDMWKRPAMDKAANSLAGRMRLCRQKAVWSRTPYRLTVKPAQALFYSEQLDSSGTWVLDPPDTVRVDHGITLSIMAGGSELNTDILFEGRGTVSASDAPTIVDFMSARGDTLTVQLIRTGRVRISRRE